MIFAARPAPQDVVDLYVSVGWGGREEYDIETITRVVAASHFVVAYDDRSDEKGSRMVGFARVLTDDALTTWVAEIIVDPVYQRRGIGRGLMEKVIDRFGGTAIYAEAVAGVDEFFASSGLTRRPGLTVCSRTASQE